MLRVFVKGLPPGGHVIAIHEGESIEGGCSAAGAPLMETGTYGVITADRNGEAFSDEASPVLNIIKDSEIEGKFNILGKTAVIHEKDDISSGEAGDRLCCGVITYIE